MCSTIMGAENPDGFRLMKFGMEYDSVKTGMTFSRTDPSYGGIDHYTLDIDKLELAGTPLISIEYGFWQGILGSIIILYEGSHYSIQGALKNRFGNPYQPNEYIEKWYWNLSRSSKKNTITHEYNEYQNEGVVWFTYKYQSQQQEKWQKEKEKKAAEEDF